MGVLGLVVGEFSFSESLRGLKLDSKSQSEE